jgi:S1-C subfamily serine protease
MLNFKFNKYFYTSVIINFIFIILSFSSFSQQSKCNEIKKICLMLNQVVGIKTPMMVASGTILNKYFIITNRHVIEDHKQVIIKFYDGSIKKAYPIPHNYPVDLVILTLNKDIPLPYKLIDPYLISETLIESIKKEG